VDPAVVGQGAGAENWDVSSSGMGFSLAAVILICAGLTWLQFYLPGRRFEIR
jgi:hypothetical protein